MSRNGTYGRRSTSAFWVSPGFIAASLTTIIAVTLLMIADAQQARNPAFTPTTTPTVVSPQGVSMGLLDDKLPYTGQLIISPNIHKLCLFVTGGYVGGSPEPAATETSGSWAPYVGCISTKSSPQQNYDWTVSQVADSTTQDGQREYRVQITGSATYGEPPIMTCSVRVGQVVSLAYKRPLVSCEPAVIPAT